MEKICLVFTFMFMTYSLFSQNKVENGKTISDHKIEIMLGTAVGTNGSVWLSSGFAFSNQIYKKMRLGVCIEYVKIGHDIYGDNIEPGYKPKESSYFASMTNGAALSIDFIYSCILSKKVSFIGIFDGGFLVTEKSYGEFGIQLGVQPGFRFRLNEKNGLALNVRPAYKYISGAQTSVIGLMLGVSF